ncbi:hypothetical protein PROFUN_10679 [Planoprotostelium fungivorum]|uniref:Uncharacterized protein n=1 Tax=Planoprotostelium fungivorum TaxID=1890364 RepID=A0A2P6MUV6_9EUKA|nr:hypothetical protein PROFUN_10679 [Planoprotostelium fungivorum]
MSENRTIASTRAIQVSKFIKHRSYEFSKLANELKPNGGVKRSFQTLPKHLRRRTMSWNIHRLPRRMRFSAHNEMKDTAPPKKLTRKYRVQKRRAQYALQDYVRRQNKFKWLETHIWHAKRMKMINIWGHKIAERPLDKHQKAMYRATQHGCVIHDMSYHSAIEITSSQQNIVDLFSNMTDRNPLSSISNQMYIQGKREGSFVLYERDTYPHGALGPVTFQWDTSIGERKRKLYLWVHPLFHQTILSHLTRCVEDKEDLQVTSLEGQLVRLKIMGPQSHTILRQVIHPQKEKCPAGASVWESLQGMRSPASVSPGAVISLVVDDPRLTFPPKHWRKVPSIDKTRATAGNCLLWSTRAADSSLWTRLEDRQAASGQGEGGPSGSVPVVLVQQKTNLRGGFGSGRASGCSPAGPRFNPGGWDIILPSGLAMSFWMSLVYAGGRAIGLRDIEFIQWEQSLPLLSDYPDTPNGLTHFEQLGRQAKQHYDIRPPSKRPNYVKLQSSHPFVPAWGSLTESGTVCVLRNKRDILSALEGGESDSLVRVSVRMSGAGTIEDRCIIYRPDASDLKSIAKRPTKWIEEVEKKKRRVIGYVNKGAYSYVRGRPYGRGLCALKEVAGLQRVEGDDLYWVIVKCVDSPVVRAATLQVTL